MKTIYCILLVLMEVSFVSAQSITFSLASSSPLIGSNAMKGIITRDMNNDGKRDIVTGDAYGSAINVFLGSGTAQFTTATSSYSLNGNGPIFTAFADFNGDSQQDIAIANYNSNYLSVKMGTSAGPFTTSPNSTYTIGNQPYCVDVADFNMDNKMDIITCSANGYSLFIFHGNGAGSFTVAPNFPISTPPLPCFVYAGHFNQDNLPDFAYVTAFSNLLYVFLNNGNGTFSGATGSPYSTGTEPRTIAHKDLNADGYEDLVVPNAQSDNVYVYMGSANGSFSVAAGSPFLVGNYPYQVAIADYDQNGTQDLAITSSNNNSLYLYSGLGTGSFVASGSPISVGYMPHSIVTDDFNSDGKADLVVGDWASPNLHIFLNTSTVCTVSATINYSIQSGGLVNFASTSTGTTAGTTYSWSFGDGTSSVGNTVSHTYTTGIYSVTLAVVNGSTCSSATTKTLAICLLSPNFSYSVGANGLVSYANTSTGEGSSSVYFWNFGDGTNGTGSVTSHTYLNGTYTAVLTVSTNSLCQSAISKSFSVCALSPSFSTSVSTNGQANFVNTSPVSGTATSYFWNFGDGGTATGPLVSHNYSTGSYVVSLVVTDYPNCSATATNNVFIETITDISDMTAALNLLVYPNPAKNAIKVRVPESHLVNDLQFELYSLTGSQVINVQLKNAEVSVNVEHLPVGAYFYKLRQGSATLKTGRIVLVE